VPVPFPEPTTPADDRAEVLLGYLDWFRSELAVRVTALPEGARRVSRLPSGWTPLELVRHLTFVELRWLEWGFAGRTVPDPWGDRREGRWYVGPDDTAATLLADLEARAARSREIVRSADLADVGRPGPRWDGAPPATLERILLHLVQEYARHLGHLDVVSELAGGPTGG
jgi:uncharacterized damage-inducible protein DinB